MAATKPVTGDRHVGQVFWTPSEEWAIQWSKQEVQNAPVHAHPAFRTGSLHACMQIMHFVIPVTVLRSWLKSDMALLAVVLVVIFSFVVLFGNPLGILPHHPPGQNPPLF